MAITSRILLVASLGLIGALSACSVHAGGGSTPSADPSTQMDEARVLVIGVVDLRADDLMGEDALWEQAFPRARRHPRVLSGGAGAAAALSLVDGRAPLERFRAGGRVAKEHRQDARVIELPATLRSEPEWIRGGMEPGRVRRARDPLPDPASVAAGTSWQVLLLDPFAHRDVPLTPRAGRRDEAGRRWLRETLTAWITSFRANEAGATFHLILTGVPRRPPTELRTRALPGRGPVPRNLEVPLLQWQPTSGSASLSRTAPATVHGAVARLRGAADPPGYPWSAWWSEYSGGLYLELPAEAGRPTLAAWLDERGRWSAAAGTADSEVAEHRPALDDAARTLLFGAGALPPRLWCAVRGSEEIDFVDLTLVTEDVGAVLHPWALEDIDMVREPSDRVRTLALAAETRADGAIVDLGWPPRTVEIRLAGEMPGGPRVGIPLRVAAPGGGEWTLGFGGLRLAPFTRPFWSAVAAGWPTRADDWWPSASVGVHLGVAVADNAPAPATWTETETERR